MSRNPKTIRRIPIPYRMAVRYQMARFCEWEQYKHGDYKYRLTPEPLRQAEENGLLVNHLLALLQKHSE